MAWLLFAVHFDGFCGYEVGTSSQFWQWNEVIRCALAQLGIIAWDKSAVAITCDTLLLYIKIHSKGPV